MKQTPIQKAITEIKEEIRTSTTDNNYSAGYKQALINTENRLLDLLLYEQEFRNEIWDAGVKAMSERGVEVRALCDVDEWFNENYTTSPIEFDAKKVAESLYENWGKYLKVTFGVVKKIQLKAILIKHLDNNTTYTQIQRQQILTELEKI